MKIKKYKAFVKNTDVEVCGFLVAIEEKGKIIPALLVNEISMPFTYYGSTKVEKDSIHEAGEVEV